MTEIDKDITLTERYYRLHHDKSGNRKALEADFLFLMLDLDGLKQINDVYGHMAGDRALIQVRDLLVEVCRSSDTIIRWGGDEFLIVGRNVNTVSAERLAERLREAVATHPFDLGLDEPVSLSCSVGFAQYPFLPNEPTRVKWEQVVTIADRALYLAKTSGRNGWVAIFGNENTSGDDLVRRVNDEAKEMLEGGALEFRTSHSNLDHLVWDRV